MPTAHEGQCQDLAYKYVADRAKPELSATLSRALFPGRYFSDDQFGALVRGGRMLEALDYFSDCLPGPPPGSGGETPWFRLYTALCVRAFVDSMASKHGHTFLEAKRRLKARAPAGLPELAVLESICEDPSKGPAVGTLTDDAICELARSVTLMARDRASAATSGLALDQMVTAAMDLRDSVHAERRKVDAIKAEKAAATSAFEREKAAWAEEKDALQQARSDPHLIPSLLI